MQTGMGRTWLPEPLPTPQGLMRTAPMPFCGLFRVKGLNSDIRDQIVNEALKLQDKKIDLLGLIGNIPRNLFGIKKALLKFEKNSIWCSKMIYQSYYSVGIKLVSEDESGKITSHILSKSKLLEVVR